MTRITVAHSEPFEGASEASAWLQETAADGKARSAAARQALELLNRALDALREAAEDPLVAEVGLTGALAIRLGYGTGEQLADGLWTEARQLPEPPPPRHLELDPQQHVAEALGGLDTEAPRD